MCLIHQLQCLRHGGCQVNVCRTSLRSMPCWTARSLVPVHCQALTSKMLLIDKLLAISPKVPIFTCNFISYHLTWTFLSNHTAMFTVYKAHLYLVLSLIVHLLNQCSLLWFLLLFFFFHIIKLFPSFKPKPKLTSSQKFSLWPQSISHSLSLSLHMVTLSMMLLFLGLSFQIFEASIDEVFYPSSNPQNLSNQLLKLQRNRAKFEK